ncbi:MAG: hypothetical protein DHS20C21_10260 [Gemmatimonadota bacterium]|nr:MAG: hypothetical protein DHS20C21_10260 [Gemmatimonadota bacterium]
MSEPKPERTLSIRWIVSGAAIALTAITVLAVSFVGERNARSALTRELQTRVLLEARNLAMTSSRALLSEFPELTLGPIIAEMSEDRVHLEQTAVVDLERLIRGHANARRIGDPYSLPDRALPVETTVGLMPGEQMLADDEILIAAAPVRHPQGHHIGTAYVSFPRDYVSSVLAEARRAQLLLVALMLAIGIVVAPLYMAHLLRPIGALREGLERIGRGDFDSPVRLQDRTEFGLLARTMNRMASGLRDAQEQKVERERLSHEVELAREIQSSLLPDADVAADGFTIDGSHHAAAEVGGDIWDVFPLEGGRTGIAIADVSGKGLAGCLVTSMLSALLRAFRNEESSPSALLARLERHLPLRSGTFITMFYGILDPAEGSLVFASAAHNPLLVRRADTGKNEWYRTQGIPIGAVKGGALARTLRDERISLRPGDVLVQYTDGINEAFELSGELQFGLERLQEATAAGADGGPRRVIHNIRRSLEEWTGDQPPLDDETLLVVRYDGVVAATPGTGEAAPANAPAELPIDSMDPLQVLEKSRAANHHCTLPADLDQLHELRGWIESCPGFSALKECELAIAETAVYEVCANITEHGYGSRSDARMDVWWLPQSPNADDPPAGPGLRGHFVILDAGKPFLPQDDPVDLHDPGVRRRGRGLGLEIVREVMRRVSYNPGTPAGNITLLAFDSSKPRAKETSHG